MLRRLQLLILAVVLVVAAFSTGEPFLFFLVYLGPARRRRQLHPDAPRPHGPRGRLRREPAPGPRRRPAAGDVHAAQHGPRAQAVAGGPQPHDAPGRAAGPGAVARRAAASGRGSSGPARPARPLPHRAAPDPDRRPVRLLRGVGRRWGRGSRSSSTRGSSRCPLWRLPPASIEGAHAQPERTLQTTPLATTVRPYAPGDSMNRIHWRTTARTGEIQVKEFDLEQTADVWIVLDLERGARGGLRRRLHHRGRRARRRVHRGQGARPRTGPSASPSTATASRCCRRTGARASGSRSSSCSPPSRRTAARRSPRRC